MRNSLIVKLLGAFLFVIAIGGAVIFTLMPKGIHNAFQYYSNRSSQMYANRLIPVLSAYYESYQSWDNVETDLFSTESDLAKPGMGGYGMGKNQNWNENRQGNGSIAVGMSSMEFRVILTDNKGIVVMDSQKEMNGNQISKSDLQRGLPVNAQDQQVGTLLVSPFINQQQNSLTDDFYSSMNKAIISSAGIAGAIAILLGSILFLQIISPIRKLKAAAMKISGGDLNQRVDIRTQDEFGELGKTFNKMAESLLTAEVQRRHLTADIAHELRTPLTAMQGTLEGIQDGILPFSKEQIAVLYSETLLLNRLVNDLRLISLSETGQLKLDFSEINIEELVKQVIDQIKPQADQKGITIINDFQGETTLTADADRIKQVLMNLIRNSLKYALEGGMISIQVKSDIQQNNCEIVVQDTGSGVDPVDLPYIFDRFYRGDESRNRSSGGSGLGLAIVKNLVEAHGGKVWAESPIFHDQNQTGYGTRIVLTLPLLRTDQTARDVTVLK